jgi:hypothetical protein
VNRDLLLHNNGSGINTFINEMYGNCGVSLSINNSPVERGSSTIVWERRQMGVDHSVGVSLEPRLLKNGMIGYTDKELRLKSIDTCHEARVVNICRLIYSNA